MNTLQLIGDSHDLRKEKGSEETENGRWGGGDRRTHVSVEFHQDLLVSVVPLPSKW